MRILYGKEFATHAGTHHSDDVVASFFLTSLGASVTRVDKPANTQAELFDFGGGRFDHHQANAEVKADGTPFSSAGLIFREWENEIVRVLTRNAHLSVIGITNFTLLIREFVDFIDAADNGIAMDSKYSWFPQAVSSLNYVSKMTLGVVQYTEEKSVSLQSIGETALMQSVVTGLIEQAKAITTVQESVVSGSPVLVLSEPCPWSAPVQSFNALNPDSKLLSVVFQSNREGWVVQQVPVAAGSFECVQFLPSDWLESAPAGLVFCHKNLFMAVFSTKEEAVNAANSLY